MVTALGLLFLCAAPRPPQAVHLWHFVSPRSTVHSVLMLVHLLALRSLDVLTRSMATLILPPACTARAFGVLASISAGGGVLGAIVGTQLYSSSSSSSPSSSSSSGSSTTLESGRDASGPLWLSIGLQVVVVAALLILQRQKCIAALAFPKGSQESRYWSRDQGKERALDSADGDEVTRANKDDEDWRAVSAASLEAQPFLSSSTGDQ